MTSVEVRPATPERHDDVAHALSGGGDGRSCQCQWWLMTRAEWDATSREERERRLNAELGTGPPPGLVAYVDGVAAGWVRVGPRAAQPRLARTRALAASREPFDAPDVWAITCFVIRREFRGRGLTGRLIGAAVVWARDHGARIIEAYPVDPTARDGQVAVNDLYRGVHSTFVRAGFREVARPRADLVLMELTVDAATEP